jgi:membrane protease YdiL (CAAX protease family)
VIDVEFDPVFGKSVTLIKVARAVWVTGVLPLWVVVPWAGTPGIAHPGVVVDKVGVPRPVRVVRRHPLAAFLFFTFAYSWGYWIPVALAGGQLSHFPGLLGPMLAAFTVAAVSNGVAGTRDLLARMVRWRVPIRWYAAAVIPGVAGLLGLAVLSVTGRGLPSVAELSTMAGLPSVGWFGMFALVFVINGYGEEVGWRGLAWPRLRERYSMAVAALMLAVCWSVWHVPTFWIDSGLRGFDPLLIPGWLVGLAAGAVVLGWLYERACSSLLIVALFHALLNMASATPATEGFPSIVVTFVVIVWAVRILRAEAVRHPAEAETRM